MTSKALRKQLLAAVAMVIVAAIAVSSSTFAWFAGNNTVKASEMKVQAVAEGGIEIMHASKNEATASNWSTVDASPEDDAMLLFPTSTFNGDTWAHASAATSAAFTAAAGTYEMLTLVDGVTTENIYNSTTDKQLASQKYDANGKQYYRLDQFKIRTVKGTGTAQKVRVKEIGVTGAPAALDQSLKVLVKVGTGDSAVWYNYNAATGGSSARNVATAVNDSGNPSTVGAVTYKVPGAASNLLCTCAAPESAAVAGEPQLVSIYIYYEGEDVNHYSDAAGNLAELNVTVSFESVDTVDAFSKPAAPAAASAAVAAGTTAINANP